MVSPLFLRWVKTYIAGGIIIGTGALLFKYTTPTDDQLIQSLSPELRAQYEREKSLRQREQQELMKIVKETANSNSPIWETGDIKSPWDKDYRNSQSFANLRAEELQKSELASIRNQLDEIRLHSEERTNQLVQSNRKNRWWFW